LSEKPEYQRPRRLADWLNPTGTRKVHSLIDKVYKRKNLEMAWEMSTYEEAAGRGEITPNMIGVLSLLAQRSGMSQAELARLFGMERATTGAIVARAMQAGFVTRKNSSGDARRYALFLTNRDEQMLVKLRHRIPEHEKQLPAGCSSLPSPS
jgi:DNA-binding MarR family transcriptional regulator